MVQATVQCVFLDRIEKNIFFVMLFVLYAPFFSWHGKRMFHLKAQFSQIIKGHFLPIHPGDAVLIHADFASFAKFLTVSQQR